jgi:hypothetical protein
MASGDGKKATDEEGQGSDDCSSKIIPRIKSVPFSVWWDRLFIASGPFHRGVRSRWMCDNGDLHPQTLVDCSCRICFPRHPALDHGMNMMVRGAGGVVEETTGSSVRVRNSGKTE